MATTEQVTVDGITYDVTQAWTPESLEAAGNIHTARHMRNNGATRQLGLIRPKSRGAQYFVVEFEHKRTGRRYFGHVASLGR